MAFLFQLFHHFLEVPRRTSQRVTAGAKMRFQKPQFIGYAKISKNVAQNNC
jgi:hypothetical protein